MKAKTVMFFWLFLPLSLYGNKYSDSLHNLLKTLKFDTNRVNTYYKLSSYYAYYNNDSAMFFACKGDSLARKIKYEIGIADGYFYKAYSFEALALFDSALVYYAKDIEAFKKLGMLRGMAYGYYNLGNIYCNKGDYLKAYDNFLNYHRLSVQLKDSIEIAQSFCALAKILYLTGDLKNALSYLSDGIKINHRLNIIDSDEVLILLGSIYLEQHEFEIALKHFNKGLSLAQADKDLSMDRVALFSYNVGLVYSGMKDYDKAYRYYKYADSLYVEINFIQNHALISRQIAEVLFYKRQITESLKYSKLSFQLCSKLNDKNGVAEVLSLHGDINYYLKKYNEAVINWESAFKYASETSELKLQKSISAKLSKVYAHLGNFKKAFVYEQKFNELSDKILNKENVTKLAQMDLQYNFDKTQAEENLKQQKKEMLYISEVERQKTMRKAILFSSVFLLLFIVSLFLVYRLKQKQRLHQMERELNVSVQQALSQQMNPHFIFNCLNSIYSLMLENKNDEASSYFTMFASLMRKNLEYSQKSAIYIYLELEALEMYVKLEQLRFNNSFSFNIQLDDELDPHMYKIPPLLFQPFVENSILHGVKHKKGEGKIEVRLNYYEKEIICQIEDNGVGRENAKILEEKKNHVSYALSLTRKRLDIISVLFGKSTKLTITDKKDEQGNATGTLVEFGIPFIA